MIPKPPNVKDLPIGTVLNAGLGKSTVVADFDFETYSPAGFVWNQETKKFDRLKGANAKGLEAVGTACYTEHPQAEVLCLAYNLKDGKGSQQWIPGNPNPILLFEYIAQGGLLEAWNCAFEFWVWVNICMPKYGWPMLPKKQLRDAMAKSRAFGLPGALKKAGEVLNIQNKKDNEGKRLLDKFSIPRNPTLKDGRLRIELKDDVDDANKLLIYNIRDIEAEAEISSLLPDLTDSELEFWQCDQLINNRGITMDKQNILNCIHIIENAYQKYNSQLYDLTKGMVSAASEVQKLKDWMVTQGIEVKSLNAQTVSELLELPDLPLSIKKVLNIRELIGGAAVKKLYGMLNKLTSKNKVHDLFIYHSARTGRAAGSGIQPQNFPNMNGFEVRKCQCCHYYSVNFLDCPWCGKDKSNSTVSEWDRKAMEDSFELIKTKSLSAVEYVFEDALTAISGCLRGLFISSENKDFICSDYSAIEAVVLAALAGEQWRLDVFNTHGKIYEMSASKITGKDFNFYVEYKKEYGKHHSDRKIGKVAELACFTHDTQVLTKRGYVAIMDVHISDELWDGIKWVKHSGIINKGKKEILFLDGVRMTPNHPISLGISWMEAKLLALSENMLIQALAKGSENLPIWENGEDQKKVTDWQNVNAHAVNLLARLILILGMDDQHDVINVLKNHLKPPILNGSKHIKNVDILYQILNIDEDWEIVFLQLSAVVTMIKTPLTQIMEGVALKFSMRGAEKNMNFLHTLLKSPDGIMKCLKWIGLIVTEIMNLEISDLSRDQIISLINEKYKIYKKESKNLNYVYDIVNAGTLNRFTIKTQTGHLIVHNSGYQGWLGAWKQFGADKFFSEDEIKRSILAWRAASPAIVEMWGGQRKDWYPCFYGLEGAAVQAVLNPGEIFEFRGLSYLVKQDILYCKLLSGRYLIYHKPRLTPSERIQDTLSLSFEGWNTNPKMGGMGWIRMNTYGGKLTENVVQATARDILANAIINLEKSGYPVVLHVHDEIVCEVPEGVGSIEEFEKIMSTLPSWAKDWPVKASGGWRAKRYSK